MSVSIPDVTADVNIPKTTSKNSDSKTSSSTVTSTFFLNSAFPDFDEELDEPSKPHSTEAVTAASDSELTEEDQSNKRTTDTIAISTTIRDIIWTIPGKK